MTIPSVTSLPPAADLNTPATINSLATAFFNALEDTFVDEMNEAIDALNAVAVQVSGTGTFTNLTSQGTLTVETTSLLKGNVTVGEDANDTQSLTVLTSASGIGALWFGDSGDTTRGGVQYDHSTDELSFWANDASMATLSSAGVLTLTSNLDVTRGSGTLDVDFTASSGSALLDLTSTSSSVLTIAGNYTAITMQELDAGPDLGIIRIANSGGTFGLFRADDTETIINYMYRVTTDINGATGQYFNIGGTTMATINSNGLGVGTSPISGKRLSVYGGGGLLVSDSGTVKVEVIGDESGTIGIVGTDTNHDLVLRANNSERMRMIAAGGVSVTGNQALAGYLALTTTDVTPIRIEKTFTGTTSRIQFLNSADGFKGNLRYDWTTGTYGSFEIHTPYSAAEASGKVYECNYDGHIWYTHYLSKALEIDSSGHLLPGSDNAHNNGSASYRWKEIFSANGTINTSDARLKTDVRKMTPAEVSAAQALASEIGVFQFLESITEKGDRARHHVGMTVQKAIEVMEAHDLDPAAYGFICYDEWEATPAVEEKLDEDGSVTRKAEPARPAGNLYSFRADQLYAFITRGQAERLDKLETLSRQ